MQDLPKITAQMQTFLIHYISNGENGFQAYKSAYNCEKMKDKTVYEEASKLLNHPKITPWIEYYKTNQQETIKEELKYTAKEHFNELENLKEIALQCKDKNSNPNVNAAIKAEELKGKLAGLYTDKHEIKANGLMDLLGDLQ